MTSNEKTSGDNRRPRRPQRTRVGRNYSSSPKRPQNGDRPGGQNAGRGSRKGSAKGGNNNRQGAGNNRGKRRSGPPRRRRNDKAPALEHRLNTETKGPAIPEITDEDTVRIITVSGVEEIGRNMNIIETKDDIIVIDAGFAFVSEDTGTPGVDYMVVSHLLWSASAIHQFTPKT